MNAVSKRQSVKKRGEPRRERQPLTTLVAKTVQVRALSQELGDDYEAVYFIGILCDHSKQKHNLSDPANRAKENAHEAFARIFQQAQAEIFMGFRNLAICLLRLLRLQLLLCRCLFLLLRYMSICCGWSQGWADWCVSGMGEARGGVEQGSGVGLGGYRGRVRSRALAKESGLGFFIVYKL
jgi:hypothetical protein